MWLFICYNIMCCKPFFSPLLLFLCFCLFGKDQLIHLLWVCFCIFFFFLELYVCLWQMQHKLEFSFLNICFFSCIRSYLQHMDCLLHSVGSFIAVHRLNSFWLTCLIALQHVGSLFPDQALNLSSILSRADS